MHGNSQIPTPHIDALAAAGARLDGYYVQAVCSPTRSTLMTGRSVIHTGVYDPVLEGNHADLSRNFTLLPQYLQELGYSAHMVGKWHLGESSWRFTPVGRGYESYSGYLGGAQDYWTHGKDCQPLPAGINRSQCLDFWNNKTANYADTCQDGNACPVRKYSAHTFVRDATRAIRNVAASGKPLFLYLAMQSVHAPLLARLLSAPWVVYVGKISCTHAAARTFDEPLGRC